MNSLVHRYMEAPLIGLIACGLVIGIALAVAVPQTIPVLAIFGKLFVGALKGIAPILVFVLVRNAMARDTSAVNTSMRPVIVLYVIGT
ncbi:MAG: serine/threonine transporter SstT, partial [Schwartzia sp.]|nr:serine/threonine transporter SstT [Schwartzia sp. (in: firmicutes)]